MPEQIATDFGQRLRELRERAGLTQAQLAEKAGLHPQGVVKLERGEREPAWATAVALADALDVSTEAFRQPAGKSSSQRKAGRSAKPAAAAKRKGD